MAVRKVDELFNNLVEQRRSLRLSHNQIAFFEGFDTAVVAVSQLTARSSEIQDGIVSEKDLRLRQSGDGNDTRLSYVGKDGAMETTWRVSNDESRMEGAIDESAVLLLNSLDRFGDANIPGQPPSSESEISESTGNFLFNTEEPSNQLLATQSWFDPFNIKWLPEPSIADMTQHAVTDSTGFISSFSDNTSTVNIDLFARQLQLRALQRGYSIITGSTTPRTQLDQTFGHCIPAKSRSHIVHRVEYLLQFLSEACVEAMRKSRGSDGRWMDDTEPTPTDLVSTTNVATNPPSLAHSSTIDTWTRRDASGTLIKYLDANDVSAYVLSNATFNNPLLEKKEDWPNAGPVSLGRDPKNPKHGNQELIEG